jgi:G:T/U-mismatch repair DNA glycosylase
MATHPWLEKYPIKKESKYLILGTHPPMPYCGKLEFYYGNMSEFWRLLDEVYPNNNLYNNGCPELDSILSFLDKIKISVSDLVYKTNVDRFSTDNKMGKIGKDDLNPFLKCWIEDSNVITIFFTSFGGSNSAKQLFKKWYRKEFEKVCKISKSHENTIELYGREIRLIDLFSPSPTARRSANNINEFKEYLKSNPNGNFDAFRIDYYKQKLPSL